MQNQQELVGIIQRICKSALDGSLKLENYYKLWPEEANANPFFKQIYEDIEDGVQHIPGFFFRRGINYKAWHNSDLYLTLYLDSILLNFDKSSDGLLRCRNFVLGQKNLSEEVIKKKVKEYFVQTR